MFPLSGEPLPPSLIRDLLVWVCNEEQKEVPNEVLDAISQTCEGSPRQALVSLDQVIDIDDPNKALKIITQAEDVDCPGFSPEG